jgi:hypothetical protein
LLVEAYRLPDSAVAAVRQEITAIVIREPSAIDSGFGCP